MKSANYVVTPAVTRSDDDEDDDEATPEEHRNLRRVVGKSQFLAPRWPDIAIATHRLARSLAKPTKSDIVASKRLLRYLCGTLDLGWKLLTRKHDVHDFDSVHRQRLCVRQTRTTVRLFVGDFAGQCIHQWWSENTSVVAQSSCEAEYIANTTAQPKQSTSKLCSYRAG